MLCTKWGLSDPEISKISVYRLLWSKLVRDCYKGVSEWVNSDVISDCNILSFCLRCKFQNQASSSPSSHGLILHLCFGKGLDNILISYQFCDLSLDIVLDFGCGNTVKWHYQYQVIWPKIVVFVSYHLALLKHEACCHIHGHLIHLLDLPALLYTWKLADTDSLN